MRKADYPCVFAHPTSFLKEQVDPRVKDRWEERFGRPTPFGNLRKLWREEHCAELNPYTSTTCPYGEQECGIAFLQAVERTVSQARDKRSASGYFRAVARSSAFRRADEKPLSRDHGTATKGSPRSGDARASRQDHPTGYGTESQAEPDDGELAMRRRHAPAHHIGDLLRGLDPGSRQRPTDDGETGAE